MTTDLWMLLGAAGLQFALIMAAVTPRILRNGIPWASGNRDETPETTGWAGRADRCARNMQESLPIFACLVLVAHVSGSADTLTANGAVVYLAARMVHAGVYIAGITYLRTAVWSVSLVGWAMITYAIVT